MGRFANSDEKIGNAPNGNLAADEDGDVDRDEFEDVDGNVESFDNVRLDEPINAGTVIRTLLTFHHPLQLTVIMSQCPAEVHTFTHG